MNGEELLLVCEWLFPGKSCGEFSGMDGSAGWRLLLSWWLVQQCYFGSTWDTEVDHVRSCGGNHHLSCAGIERNPQI